MVLEKELRRSATRMDRKGDRLKNSAKNCESEKKQKDGREVRDGDGYI